MRPSTVPSRASDSCLSRHDSLSAMRINPPLISVQPLTLASLCVLLLASGCARSWYREQADREAAEVVAEKVTATAGPLESEPFSITPGPRSRLYDSTDPDHPPLPPDDPASHNLMHTVDDKDGYSGWHENGELAKVDSENWRDWLPRDADGVVALNMADVVKVARSHSRSFQQEREDLYLSALDVTFERFRFDTQFFAGTDTEFRHRGKERGSTSTLDTETGARLQQLSATGTSLVVGLANSLVWQFSGSGSEVIGTMFDFSIVQPLLRFGGRARVLEGLTQSERTLLANVRQMEQFQQGFFVNVVTGRNSGSGPIRRGAVGQSGLGLIAGSPSGRTGASDAGGYLGLLQDLQQIRIQETNVTGLRDSLAVLEATFDAGRLSNSLQVFQARQALYNAQSSLLSSRAAFQSKLDSFKIEIGLPPDVPLRIQDSLLDRFNLIDPSMVALQDAFSEQVFRVLPHRTPPTKAALTDTLRRIEQLKPEIDRQIATLKADLANLEVSVPSRVEQLLRLKARTEEQQADVDPRIYDVEIFKARVQQLAIRPDALQEDFDKSWSELKMLPDQFEMLKDDEARKELATLATEMSGRLLELSLDQAAARLEGITLSPIDVQPAAGIEIARANRLDWMNARANLVDAWRQIEFNGNALEADLDLVISGEAGRVGPNGSGLDVENGELRFGLQFDSPITRLAERNRYRETLINYQRARRDYMLFEDRVAQSIRNTLRIVELSQLNFEVRRAAVQGAIAQVDLARLRVSPPPKPGRAATFSPTTARDLVSALSDLLDAQNDFLNVWVNYEVLRMLVDFELGTMRLNEDGLWSDSGFNQHLQNEGVLDGQSQPAADDEGMLMKSTARHWKRTVRPVSFSDAPPEVEAAQKTD
jgi:outer membrane protein TolC